MRIRIQQLKLMRIHADPDPKPCFGQKEGLEDSLLHHTQAAAYQYSTTINLVFGQKEGLEDSLLHNTQALPTITTINLVFGQEEGLEDSLLHHTLAAA
jgi:hypothetical protein